MSAATLLVTRVLVTYYDDRRPRREGTTRTGPEVYGPVEDGAGPVCIPSTLGRVASDYYTKPAGRVLL